MVKLTVQAVKDAADVIEALSKLYEYNNPECAEWSPKELREELPHITTVLEQEELLDEVAQKIIERLGVFGGPVPAEKIKSVLRSYEMERDLYPESQLVTGTVKQC